MQLDFRDLRTSAEATVGRLLSRIHPRASHADLVRDVDELCLACHTIGAGSLLLDGYSRDFFLALACAAENWRRLLAHLRGRGQQPPPATSHNPLLGAVAAGQWELARGIVQLSATERQADADEYEDDFDWALLLQQLIAPRPGQPHRTADLITRLERSGADTYDERLGVARALHDGDAEAFFAAFTRALLAHGEEVERLASTPTLPVIRLAPYRYIWLEGLALLRLGELAGFTSNERLLYCPPLARVRLHVPPDEDWLVSLPA